MKDLVWTLIIIWLVYKVAAIFRTRSSSQKSENSFDASSTAQKSPRKNGTDVLDKEGEYIDYEEVK